MGTLRASCHDGVRIPRIDNRLFVVGMRDALFRRHEARAQLHAVRAECHSRRQSSPIRNSACRNHGDRNGIHGQRHQGHQGQLIPPDAAAGFHPLGDHGIDAAGLGKPGLRTQN